MSRAWNKLMWKKVRILGNYVHQAHLWRKYSLQGTSHLFTLTCSVFLLGLQVFIVLLVPFFCHFLLFIYFLPLHFPHSYTRSSFNCITVIFLFRILSPLQQICSVPSQLLHKLAEDSLCVLTLGCLFPQCRLRLISSKVCWKQTYFYIPKREQTGRFSDIYILLALHIPQNYNQHLLAIDKIEPSGCKTPSHYCPLEFSDQQTPHLAIEWLHLDM